MSTRTTARAAWTSLKSGSATGKLRTDLRLRRERPRLRMIFQRSNDFRDVADMAEIVKGPLVHHMRHRDRAKLGVHARSRGSGIRQRSQIFEIQFALLL